MEKQWTKVLNHLLYCEGLLVVPITIVVSKSAFSIGNWVIVDKQVNWTCTCFKFESDLVTHKQLLDIYLFKIEILDLKYLLLDTAFKFRFGFNIILK